MQTHASHAADRRRFSRIAFHRPAELTLTRDAIPCRILDLSLKGALLIVPEGARCGAREAAWLDIALDDLGTEHIRMEGELAYVEGDRVGFACVELDLDSIVHLRRFVELNLGDADALHRELGALIAGRSA